jgi:serine/threonine-protein kinase
MGSNEQTDAGTGRKPPKVADRTKIGRYDLIYPLGQGGMATVYVGQVSGMAGFEKIVAVKIIHPHLVRERLFVEMFLDEAKLAAQILHPNVAAIQEVGEEDGILFMVGELVPGESLKSLIRRAVDRGTRLSHPMAAYIAAAVCSGLQAAHDLQDGDGNPLNLVHRDISPQNVLIGYNGFVKLIDFGVAQAKGRLSHTEAGTIKGKMGYLSPEQLQGKTLDGRSDLFSLGVVLYQMITGKHPFPGQTSLERLNRISAGEFKPPHELEPGVSPELEQIVMNALTVRREDRFPSASAMAETLKDYIRSQEEVVGSQQLSTIMNYLFATQIIEHKKRLRGWRERGDRTDSVPIPDLVQAGITAASRKSELSAEEISFTELSEIEIKRRGSAKLLIAAVAVVAVLGIGAVLLFLAPWRATEEKPVAPEPVPEMAKTPSAAETVEEAPPPAGEQSRSAEVKFTFVVKPRFARIQVDGEPLVVGTREIMLPGDGELHRIEIKAGGYEAKTVELSADQDREVSAELVWVGKKGKPAGKGIAKKKGSVPGKKPPQKKAEVKEKKEVLKESPY